MPTSDLHAKLAEHGHGIAHASPRLPGFAGKFRNTTGGVLMFYLDVRQYGRRTVYVLSQLPAFARNSRNRRITRVLPRLAVFAQTSGNQTEKPGSGPRALSIACRPLVFTQSFRNRAGGLLTCFLDFRLSRKTSGIRLAPTQKSRFSTQPLPPVRSPPLPTRTQPA